MLTYLWMPCVPGAPYAYEFYFRLLYQELGSRDYSPEHMGKSQLRHKFRVGERKNRSSTDSPLLNLRKISAPVETKKDGAVDFTSRKFSSTLSLLASRWKHEERAAVKRGPSSSEATHKNAASKTVTRRASAPLTSTPRSDKDDEDTDCLDAGEDCTSRQLPICADSATAYSCVPKCRSMSTPCEAVAAVEMSSSGRRSFSSNSLKRLAEARRRQSFRQEQLKSFDDILFQANTYIWDRKLSKNSSPTYSQVSSRVAMSCESPDGTTVVWNFDNL